MPTIYSLTSGADAPLREVGGKAYNLIQMLEADLAVPGGFVLTVEFFESWFESLRQTPAWTGFVSASDDELPSACDALKSASAQFGFDSRQLSQIETHLEPYADTQLFAVRSSSPEEDLEGSSFAGAYESVLGVSKRTLAEAVKRAFASCLDVRIAVYKRQKGFAIDQPKIAVVVQQQIASEKAGVGFSLNPLNNNYDEAVFNANWGQGETVVAGLAACDFYVVHKPSARIKERNPGSKELSIWLKPDGGTEERRDPRHVELCLSDEELLELTRQIGLVEQYYKQPMDIEWAFAGGQLYLLQARPITTHLTLHPEMQTAPGEPKRLYFDITISVQGILEPLSPLGLDLFLKIGDACRFEVFGERGRPPIDESIVVARNGRIYANLNSVIGLIGREKFTALVGQMDGLVSQAMQELDLSAFGKGRLSRFWLLLDVLPRMLPRIRGLRRSWMSPDEANERWLEQWTLFRNQLEVLSARNLPLSGYIDSVLELTLLFILRQTIVIYPVSKIALSKIQKLFGAANAQTQKQLEALDQSLPHNVTIEMGLALYDLHTLLTPRELDNLQSLERAITEKTAPQAFLDGWSEFLENYGHRGLKELDVAEPRFREDPRILLKQILGFAAQSNAEQTPHSLFERSRRRREEAFAFLSSTLSPPKRKGFAKLYQRLQLGGFRETHKFVMIYGIAKIRQRLLGEGDRLVRRGQLQKSADLFFLTLETIERGLADPALDLRADVARGRREFVHADQCKQIFPLLDSRGCFHRPPPPEAKPGEIIGQAVSSGTTRGRVKVLHSPDEKPLLPGEILVARATDPGWTPLFVNAAGIILEVGGPLQHGALVAREYGKPCIAGVQNAVELFQDGQLVELDGGSGIIRRLEQPDSREVSEGSFEPGDKPAS